jgi:hypothetical protein
MADGIFKEVQFIGTFNDFPVLSFWKSPDAIGTTKNIRVG